MTQPDTILGGRYKLDEVIGRGGMAEVWRAVDVRLGREVAVKRLRVDLATDPTFQARFRREAQSAAGLNHPNIVSTYDTGEEPDEKTGIAVPWIVMELVEGHTLRDLLRSDDPIPPEKAFEWTQGVLDALGTSHRAGIIHRDIKPANVMLTPSGRVKVMDFGIARAVADTSATMTQTAAVIGTAQYLSPEQARGETVDNRSDIYSAGCLLYELLCGRPPFVGDSPVSVAYQHVREAPVPPSTLDPKLTPQMDAIVLKSLAKDPAQRYQDAREMRDDIARLLAGQQVQAAVPAAPVAPTAVTTPLDQSSGATTVVAASASSASPAGVGTLTGEQDAIMDEEPKKRSPIAWILALLLAALLAIGGISAYVYLRPTSNADMATVPTVIGQTEQGASAQLTTAGFRVETTHTYGEEDTVNQVVDQNPLAGKEAPKGSAVTITINDGPKTNKIPTNIVGMTTDDARKALVEAGFVTKNITVQDASWEQEKEHLDFKAGQVVTSNPAPGADVVPATQKVVLYEATGTSRVPNVMDQTLEEATAAVEGAGLTVTSETRTVTQPSQDGRVIEQQPEENAKLDRGQPVHVVIGKYATPAPTQTQTQTATATPSATETPSAEEVDVPKVTNKPRDAAISELKAAGFHVLTTDASVSDPNLDGMVVDQSPAGGKAAKGSTVTIGVGQAAAAPSPAPSREQSSAAPSTTASKPA
ncbi:Stk1 family PASTA domain-containing Ser/Thr kinase [Luteococcus japonicus]|uniref:non-specific serine/threonine protein kinase n=1 Tax=Luteococcus japonicus LSP_Lj1 TaxID=1255658 RepID=A0A1R4JY87_9ACTN|nr:Stk1 family PASTA domain-containing Ser/Thr kinase [Luteococcus japonicus]SJN37211.1 Serine/threonine protein kinase PrkC, regulator of stationary phase [Luteococcus japonicus LSP_Lj1]